VILQRLRKWLTDITHAVVEKSRRSEGRTTKHALTCSQAGYFLNTQGAYEKALQYFEEDLIISRGKPGDRHPSMATTLNNIGWIYHDKEDFRTGLNHFQKVCDVLHEKLGDEHPWTKIALNGIQTCESKLNSTSFSTEGQ